ncbi:hypothetical protein Tco_0508261 [Tanacetum coccineum]
MFSLLHLYSSNRILFPQSTNILIFPIRTSVNSTVFKHGDDPIDATNHAMSFLSAVWFKASASGQILHGMDLAFGKISGYQKLKPLRTVITHNAELILADDWMHMILTLYAGDAVIAEQTIVLEPKLYDGNVIKNTSAIVIPDSEESLMLAEESHFKARFVPQTELSVEQAFWSKSFVNYPEPTLSSRPTKVEVPKELPKVNMVNTSLKKLKYHLAGFDMDEMIPFVKALKDLVNTFDQYLIDELSEVQNVFHQMEQAVEQHRLESKTFKVKMNQVLNENERLLEQVIRKDIMNIIVNSFVDNSDVNVRECEKCLKLKTELQKGFIEKEIYDKLFKSFTTLEKHCISLEVDTQHNQEIFQRDNSVSNQSAPSFDQLFEINDTKAQSQEKDTVIKKLKERIKSLSGKMNEDKIKKDLEEIETIII